VLPKFPAEKRQEIVDQALVIYAERYASRIPEDKGCLFWAASFNEAARSQGLQVLLQAGSAQFQFRKDNGTDVTHYSYMFEWPAAMYYMHRGQLPEMHCWSYIKTTGELVDLSVKYQPARALELFGFQWESELLPPPFVWASPTELSLMSPRFVYNAEVPACLLAIRYLARFHRNNERG
jgi:hypothetical protein